MKIWLQDVEREKAARLELETTARLQPSIVPEQSPLARTKSAYENGTYCFTEKQKWKYVVYYVQKNLKKF